MIDEAIAEHGKQAKRSDEKFPPHVMVSFVMTLALFAEEDYEEVITRLAQPLAQWGCWDWEPPTTEGLTQPCQRLGRQVGARAPASRPWHAPCTVGRRRTWWCWLTVTSTPSPTSPRPPTPTPNCCGGSKTPWNYRGCSFWPMGPTPRWSWQPG